MVRYARRRKVEMMQHQHQHQHPQQRKIGKRTIDMYAVTRIVMFQETVPFHTSMHLTSRNHDHEDLNSFAYPRGDGC